MRKTTLTILVLILAAIVYEDIPSIIQGNSLAMYAAAAAVSVLEATILTGIRYAKSIEKTYKK